MSWNKSVRAELAAEPSAELTEPEAELNDLGFWRDALGPIVCCIILFSLGPVILCIQRHRKMQSRRRRSANILSAKRKLNAAKKTLCIKTDPKEKTHVKRIYENKEKENTLFIKAILDSAHNGNDKMNLDQQPILQVNKTEENKYQSKGEKQPGNNSIEEKRSLRPSKENKLQFSKILSKAKSLRSLFVLEKNPYFEEPGKDTGFDPKTDEDVPECANYSKAYKMIQSVHDEDAANGIIDTDPFFSAYDRHILSSLSKYVTSPRELLRISFPCLMSLALCPMTLYLYQPLVNAFWWNNNPDLKALPNVNEAIMCFLMPAGVVYATSFGFAIQTAVGKQGDILKKMSKEIGMLDQITTLTSKLTYATSKQKCLVYKFVKNEAINLIQDIGNKKLKFEYRDSSWYVINILRNINVPKNVFQLDYITADKIIQLMLKTKDMIGKRPALHGRIHILQWLFLELLGFITFFGILLTQTRTYQGDLLFCMMTVFSISLLCYVVADLDSPFSGFFRVDVSVLLDLAARAEVMYRRGRMNDDRLCGYPESVVKGL